MEHSHLWNGSKGVNIYRRSYLGDGRYYQRGTCKDIKEGDTFNSRDTILRVDKIISIGDSKGRFSNPDDAKNALYEAELVDDTFVVGKTMNYQVLFNI